jgi:uncharacterized protein YbjQ (UPF0145 family)
MSEEQRLGVPAEAEQRLAEMRGQGGGPGIFTSDLSVNEFLLVKEAGFEPLGLVVGSSIYHIGFQFAGLRTSQELTVLSQAMYHARELAMTRMEAEAEELDADGVVGVRLDINFYEFGSHAGEFIAIGTAVRSRQGRLRNTAGKPFTSDLSGQDFWTLIQSGYAPLGLVMGSCVYHVGRRGVGQWLGSVGRNQELPNFTQALYKARELAIERMQTEAEELKAEGVVGVQLKEESHVWGSHTIEFFSVGTAVRPLREDHQIAKPQLVLGLES